MEELKKFWNKVKCSKIVNFFLWLFGFTCRVITVILRCFNFILEIILILTGSIKVVTKVDDDD